jgi:triosephosphate isomerase
MNSPREAAAVARAVAAGVAARAPAADLVLAPTALALPAVVAALGEAPIGVAGQNLHEQAAGAFTGEISGPMLRAAGAGWVLIGHSERRQLFGETDAGVAAKAKAALAAGLLPIVCVETLAEREAGHTRTCPRAARRAGRAGEEALALLTLAYEPVGPSGRGGWQRLPRRRKSTGPSGSTCGLGLGRIWPLACAFSMEAV